MPNQQMRAEVIVKYITAILTTLVFTLALPASGFQTSVDTPGLYPVKVNGKYGFIDRSGKVVIAPTYDKAEPFQEGLSAVRLGNKYGFIDSEGHMVIPPQFDDASSFSEGLAKVKVGTQWGYIEKSGKMVIEPQYKFALAFHQGLASVSSERISGYLDKTGKMVFTIDPSGIGSSFSEGFAGVSQHQGGKDTAFFVDLTGKQAFPSTYYIVGNFSDGLAIVEKDSDKIGYIDRTGKLAIPFQTGAPWGGFAEGLAVFFLPKNRVVYIDKTGKIAIVGDFVRADPFSEGLAAVQLKTGPNTTKTVKNAGSTVTIFTAGVKYGYIDKSGKLVIPAQFEEAGRFIGGLARVCMESTAEVDPFGAKKPCGYIDTTGKTVWPPSQ
jgi:hypothetical protein